MGIVFAPENVEHATPSIGNDGGSGGQRLDTDNSEIFFAGEKQCAGAAEHLELLGMWQSPDKLDDIRRSLLVGDRLQPLAVRSLADHHEPPACTSSCPNCEVESLVPHEARQQDVIVARTAVRGQRDVLHSDGWMNDFRTATVRSPDALGDSTRYRDERVYAGRR